MMNYDYSILVVWSKADNAYLASINELPGCIADGKTREEAFANVTQMAKEWIEVATEEGKEIPKPNSYEDIEQEALQFRQKLEAHVNAQIKSAVDDAVKKAVKSVIKFEQTESEQIGRGSRFMVGSLGFVNR